MWADKPEEQAVHARTPGRSLQTPIHSLVTSGELIQLLPSAICLPLNTSRTHSLSFNPNALFAKESRLRTTSQFSSFYPLNTTIAKQSLWSALGNTQTHISRAPLKPPSVFFQPLCLPPPNLGTSAEREDFQLQIKVALMPGAGQSSSTACRSSAVFFPSHTHTGCSLQPGKLVKATPGFLPSPKEPCPCQGPLPITALFIYNTILGCFGSFEDLPFVFFQRTACCSKTEELLHCSGAK